MCFSLTPVKPVNWCQLPMNMYSVVIFIDCKLNENKYCTCINSNFDPFVTKITNITWPPTAAFRMLELGIKSWPRGPTMSNMSLKALRGTLALCWLRWAAKFPANLAIGYHTKFFESWYVCQVDNFDNFYVVMWWCIRVLLFRRKEVKKLEKYVQILHRTFLSPFLLILD